jgi:hypothetical protein
MKRHVTCFVEKAGFEPRTLGTKVERYDHCGTRPVPRGRTLSIRRAQYDVPPTHHHLLIQKKPRQQPPMLALKSADFEHWLYELMAG